MWDMHGTISDSSIKNRRPVENQVWHYMELMHKLWIYPPRIMVEVRRTTTNADSQIQFITKGSSIPNIDLSFPLSKFIEIDKVHG